MLRWQNYSEGASGVGPPGELTTVLSTHHVVKKVQNRRRKWRIVFDALSHNSNAPSLNEVLDIRPNLLPEIIAILLRYRLQYPETVGDVTQVFLKLVFDREVRDLNGFFWYRIIPEVEGRYR
jgi:hypothetical protein